MKCDILTNRRTTLNTILLLVKSLRDQRLGEIFFFDKNAHTISFQLSLNLTPWREKMMIMRYVERFEDRSSKLEVRKDEIQHLKRRIREARTAQRQKNEMEYKR